MLLVVHGVVVEPRLILNEERYEVEVPRLGQEWAGTDIAVLSDMQIGMWWANLGMVRRAVRRVVDGQPDAVLLAGDFLYSTDPGIDSQVRTVLSLLDPLVDSGIPTFAVLGNHDYAVKAAEELTAALQHHGIHVLRNEALPLRSGREAPNQLYIVGIGPAVQNASNVDAALSQVPAEAPRVVMMHNPTTFPSVPAHAAPLAIAAHTHCGQIRLPAAPHWAYLGLTEEEARVAEGWAFPGYGGAGNRLFVTCGLGFSLLPVRINAPPQVVFFELIRPSSPG